MAAKRLTRREIVQEDKIQAFLNSILGWSSENRFLLITLLGVFLLSILGSYLWRNYQQGRSQEIQVQFSEALETFHAPVGEAVSGGEEDPIVSEEYRFQSDQERREEALTSFAMIAEAYPTSELGLLARYYQGLIKHELGQTEEAEGDLTFVMRNSAQPQIRNLARHLLVGIADSKNDRQQAAALLEEILQEAADSFPKDTILLQLARTHEAEGNTEEALEFYRRLTTEYPASEYAQEARTHLEQLEGEE